MKPARVGTGSCNRRKNFVKIDLTPMVDLGFLLITFFVMTTELSRPSALQMAMPRDDGPPGELGDSYALTLLLNGKSNYYYEGDWTAAEQEGKIRPVTRIGVRDLIIQKQKRLDNVELFKEGREGLMLLIKPSSNASYDDVITMLDEAIINQVKKYAIIQLSGEELQWINGQR